MRFGLLAAALGGTLLIAAACGDTFTAGSGGSGAGTSNEACTSVNDCTPTDDVCEQVSCQNNRCTYNPRKDETPLVESEQIPGDCQVLVCSQGLVVSRTVNDPPPSQTCLTRACMGGMVEESYPGTDVMCGMAEDQFCDGAGKCVGCTIGSDCGTHPDVCKTYTCVDDACNEEALINQPAPSQTAGDCTVVNCDASGDQQVDPDQADVPDDPDPTDCEVPICTNDGQIDASPVSNGTSCGLASDARICCEGVCCATGLICDVSGACVVQ